MAHQLHANVDNLRTVSVAHQLHANVYNLRTVSVAHQLHANVDNLRTVSVAHQLHANVDKSTKLELIFRERVRLCFHAGKIVHFSVTHKEINDTDSL